MDSKNFIDLHSSAPGRFFGDIVSIDSTVDIASSDKASSSTGHSMSVGLEINYLVTARIKQGLTSVQYILENLLGSFIVERWNSCHELIETNSKSPPVNFLAMAFPVNPKEE